MISKIVSELRGVFLSSRLNNFNPILILFYTTLWGMASVFSLPSNMETLELVTVLFLGSILSRSIGCVINDMLDRKLDANVTRTASRPFANQQVGIFMGIMFIVFFGAIGLRILQDFTYTSQIIVGIGLLFIIIYPLVKRFFTLPQLILGITFNLGILVSYQEYQGSLTFQPVFLYIIAIIWTFIYDSIYAFQDYESDKELNIHSAPILFGYSKKFLYIAQVLMIGLFAIYSYVYSLPMVSIIIINFALYLSFIQIYRIDVKNVEDCKDFFDSSWVISFLIALGLGVSGF